VSIAELPPCTASENVPVEVTQICWTGDGLPGRLHAYITPHRSSPWRRREAEAALLRGEPPPLAGHSGGYKEIVMTKGIRTTCGSACIGLVPDQDRPVVEQWGRGTVMPQVYHWEFASAPA